MGALGPYKDMETEHPQIHHAMIQALTFMDGPRLFALISLYEARITRNMQANLKMLFQLQVLPKPENRMREEIAAASIAEVPKPSEPPPGSSF